MDKIINWLLLTIIFVFDPLAIALVIAANFAFEQLKPKTVTREEVMEELNKEPEVKIVEKIVEVPVEVEKIVQKNVYNEDIERRLKLLEHPKVKQALNHMRRAGET